MSHKFAVFKTYDFRYTNLQESHVLDFCNFWFPMQICYFRWTQVGWQNWKILISISFIFKRMWNFNTARKLPSSTQTFARISLKKMSFRPISPLLFRPYLYEEIISKASVWVSDVVKWKIFHPYSLDKKKTKSRSSRPARFFLLFLLATHFCMTVFHAWKVSDQFDWVCISVSVQLRVCECIYKMGV